MVTAQMALIIIMVITPVVSSLVKELKPSQTEINSKEFSTKEQKMEMVNSPGLMAHPTKDITLKTDKTAKEFTS